MKEIIKTVKFYECENCNCQTDDKDWITTCKSCGKEICTKCEWDGLSFWDNDPQCYECE